MECIMWEYRLSVPIELRSDAKALLDEQGYKRGSDYVVVKKPLKGLKMDVYRFRDITHYTYVRLWLPD